MNKTYCDGCGAHVDRSVVTKHRPLKISMEFDQADSSLPKRNVVIDITAPNSDDICMSCLKKGLKLFIEDNQP